MQISFVVTPSSNDSPQYLVEFLTSIFTTNNQDFEVIIADNSVNNDYSLLDIANAYIKLYPHQIQVITSSKPLDIATSRNIAITNAKGKYLAFLHPTEIINQNYFTFVLPILAKYQNLDCLEYSVVYDWKQEYCFTASILLNENILFDLGAETSKNVYALVSPFIATKLFRRQIILENQLYFSKPLLFNTFFIYEFLLIAKTFISLDKVLINNKVNIINHNNIFELVNQWIHILNHYNKKNVKKKYAKEIEYAFVRYCLYNLIWAVASTKNTILVEKIYGYIKQYINLRYKNFHNNPYLSHLQSKNDEFPEKFNDLNNFLKPLWHKNKIIKNNSKFWK